jgi:hypothetical protein
MNAFPYQLFVHDMHHIQEMVFSLKVPLKDLGPDQNFYFIL